MNRTKYERDEKIYKMVSPFVAEFKRGEAIIGGESASFASLTERIAELPWNRIGTLEKFTKTLYPIYDQLELLKSLRSGYQLDVQRNEDTTESTQKYQQETKNAMIELGKIVEALELKISGYSEQRWQVAEYTLYTDRESDLRESDLDAVRSVLCEIIAAAGVTELHFRINKARMLSSNPDFGE